MNTDINEKIQKIYNICDHVDVFKFENMKLKLELRDGCLSSDSYSVLLKYLSQNHTELNIDNFEIKNGSFTCTKHDRQPIIASRKDSVDVDRGPNNSHRSSPKHSQISDVTESFLVNIKKKTGPPSFSVQFKMNLCRMVAGTINSNVFFAVNIIMPLVLALFVFMVGKYSHYLISLSSTNNILHFAKNYDVVIPINHEYFINENEANHILKKIAKDLGECKCNKDFSTFGYPEYALSDMFKFNSLQFESVCQTNYTNLCDIQKEIYYDIKKKGLEFPSWKSRLNPHISYQLLNNCSMDVFLCKTAFLYTYYRYKMKTSEFSRSHSRNNRRPIQITPLWYYFN
ncbi:hypothetical protein RF11_04050 [Thelohanellus kitauei]|uniref:Uncharacterized protein n=1 Tax=Thelohanellus kitauei TaxID=669202 RepID=A0A0C2J139_THEKT|nr:hypothetical protein RF11_04050 [Thelohanellus kitauei]